MIRSWETNLNMLQEVNPMKVTQYNFANSIYPNIFNIRLGNKENTPPRLAKEIMIGRQ